MFSLVSAHLFGLSEHKSRDKNEYDVHPHCVVKVVCCTREIEKKRVGVMGKNWELGAHISKIINNADNSVRTLYCSNYQGSL
jgi:hypothetical protein